MNFFPFSFGFSFCFFLFYDYLSMCHDWLSLGFYSVHIHQAWHIRVLSSL